MGVFTDIIDKRKGKRISDEKFRELYENFSGTDGEFAEFLNKKNIAPGVPGSEVGVKGGGFTANTVFGRRNRLDIKPNIAATATPPKLQRQYDKRNKVLTELVAEANAGDKYISTQQIIFKAEDKLGMKPRYDTYSGKKQRKPNLYASDKGSVRGFPILNELDTRTDKIDKVVRDLLTSESPQAGILADTITERTGISRPIFIQIRDQSPSYKAIKKEVERLPNFLNKTSNAYLLELPLAEQLTEVNTLIEGNPAYTYGKGKDIFKSVSTAKRDAMQYALRSWNLNKGKGDIKFFDAKGNPITWQKGIRLKYGKVSFGYKGKKYSTASLTPDVLKKDFKELYQTREALNKFRGTKVPNPFKKGKTISVEKLIRKIQVDGYGWSPSFSTLEILHGPNGVKDEPFTNLRYNTKDVNLVELTLSRNLASGKITQSQYNQAMNNLNEPFLRGNVDQAITDRLSAQAEKMKKGMFYGFEDLRNKVVAGVENLPKNSKIKICRALGAKDVGGLTQSCDEAIRKDPAKTATIVSKEIDSIPNKTPQMIQTSRAAKTLATTARSILKGTGLTILGEAPFEAAAAVNPYKRGKPGIEILEESLLAPIAGAFGGESGTPYGIGKDLNIQRLEQFVNNTGQTGALDFYNYYKNQNTLDQLNEKLERTDPEDPSYGMLLNQIDNLSKTIENTPEPTDEQGSEFFNYIQRRAGTFEANKKKRGQYGNLLVEGTTQKSVSDAASELNPYLGGALDMFITSEDPYQYGPYGLAPTQRRKLNRDPLFRETMKDFTERRNLNVMYPTTGTFAKGGLANLTTTVAPQSGPNSKGLESLRKYATKTY